MNSWVVILLAWLASFGLGVSPLPRAVRCAIPVGLLAWFAVAWQLALHPASGDGQPGLVVDVGLVVVAVALALGEAGRWIRRRRRRSP
jgi:hypothetical protein